VKASPQSWQQMQLDVRSRVEVRYSAWSFPSSQRLTTTTLDREAETRHTATARHRTKGSLNGNGGEAGSFLEGNSRMGLKASLGEKSRGSSGCRDQARAIV